MRKKFNSSTILATILVICFLMVGQVTFAAELINKVPVGADLSIELLDVEHGDAILIRKGAKTMMVDTGDPNHRFLVANKLRARGVKTIDILLLTHHHSDHIGGVYTLLNDFKVGKIYENGVENPNSKTSANLIKKLKNDSKNHILVNAGMKIHLDNDIYFQVLSPDQKELFTGKNFLNNNSIVMKMQYKDFSMLFTGDMQAATEDKVLQTYGAATLKSDVLKVAHHGSRTSSIYPFIKAVDGKIATISCGEPEKYNHPNKNVVGRLNHLGYEIITTLEHGDIKIETNGKEYSVNTSK